MWFGIPRGRTSDLLWFGEVAEMFLRPPVGCQTGDVGVRTARLEEVTKSLESPCREFGELVVSRGVMETL